jgi:hypothetical protein
LGYVIVVLLAALVGGLVYWASMRYSGDADAPRDEGSARDATHSETDGGGFLEGAHAAAPEDAGDDAPSDPTPGTTYIPVLRSRGSWQGRLSGVMGLVIAVAVAAAAAAFVLYEAGHVISRLLTGAASSG